MAMVVALGASALALGRPAGADVKASIACRSAIAEGLSGISNVGFQLNDKCHQGQDKLAMDTSACNDVSNSLFDPTGKYAKAKTESSGLITKECLSGDPVLNNYAGMNPETAVEPVIDGAVGGNSTAVVGGANQGGDNAKIKCIEAIGKMRTGIVKEVVKNSINCQGTLDKSATTFGPLDPSCVDPGTKSVAKAAIKIPARCPSLTGADVGSCDPLPDCVTGAAVASGQAIAKAIYGAAPTPSTTTLPATTTSTTTLPATTTSTTTSTSSTTSSTVSTTSSTSTSSTVSTTSSTSTSSTVSTTTSSTSTTSPTTTPSTTSTTSSTSPTTSTTTSTTLQAPTCGDGVVNGSEQCDDGPNNGTPGDPCSAQCESLAETCGPGTVAGGSITGHRIVEVTLDVPPGKQLAGVRVGFDYPQLEASIKGTGLSSVVQNSFQVLIPGPPTGFLALANDTDTDVGFIISSAENFIDSSHGAFLQVTMDECTPLSENICNRNQNVLGCCPTTDIVACNAAPDDPVLCFCGANGIVSQTDCTTAGCTGGVCASIPDAPAGSCVSGKCSASSPNPGKTCTAANETHNCSGVPVDAATCTVNHACSRLGDQANGTYGCASIFNPPNAPNGSFDATGKVGPPMVPPALPGSCPTGNTCVDQAQQMEASCTVTQPVDALGQEVTGVTCSLTITEAP